MKSVHQTREQWLSAATTIFRDWFSALNYDLPKLIRVSVGFPSRNALSNRNRAIGQCWSAPESSPDGSCHIFISPVLGDALRVADVLIHELCHASTKDHGHRSAFKQVAVAMGLTGKMTATEATPELVRRLDGVMKQLGEYPHSVLDPKNSPMKKARTRLLKAECSGGKRSGCGYIIRVTQKWIDSSGLPTCPCGEEFEVMS